ncbi:uncharacterized protein [Chironomus tepperi]|uniref:uncharacterized protein n=1 Tax=Chironomus tepperi TaxID=113505 RepID=UPI00391F86F4
MLLSIVSCATSQSVFNITAYDGQLRDIFNGLTETETRIGRLLSNLSDFVGKINGNLRMNKSRLGLELSHLQLDLQLQGSINSYETYNRLTGCNNAASKISEIDIDLMKFSDFLDRLELNMTELYHRNLHVTYDYMLSIKQVNVTQQDILNIILGVNEAIIQYLYYIMQLQVNIQYEKSISTNLKLFLKHFCECDENVYGVSHNTNSNSTLSDMEATLTARQARIIDAANATLIQARMSKDMKVVSTKLANFCQKLTKIDDYSNVTIPYSNSCLDLSKVQNFMTYRKFHFTQVLSFVMTNSSVLKFYKSLLNSTDQSPILTAVTNLETELLNYTDDLALQLSYLTLFASAMRKNAMVLKLFCGCRDGSMATTASTSKVSTSRKVVFTSPILTSTTEPGTTRSRSTTSRTTKSTSTTHKIRPTVSKVTTLRPYSNPACGFIKVLTDYNGTYIKTACLMETASNGTYAGSACQASSMQLMTVDSNMTRTALTIFVQETLSEGTFWISGGNGSEICNFVAVNGTGLVINQSRCQWNSLFSICEYNDSSVPTKVGFPTNLEACGFVFAVAAETIKEYTGYACVMAYTRSYADSSYNCMLNGMKMFNAESKLVMETLNEYLVSLYGNSSGVILWIDGYSKAGSCAVLDGSKVPFAVAGADCDQLNWSICEAPYDGSY